MGNKKDKAENRQVLEEEGKKVSGSKSAGLKVLHAMYLYLDTTLRFVNMLIE